VPAATPVSSSAGRPGDGVLHHGPLPVRHPADLRPLGCRAGADLGAGLVLHASDDSFGDEALSAEVAAMLGARQATLTGVGHWWALQDPDQAATTLNGFHASVG